VNILIWHVHGSWTTAFVQGQHRYLIPVLPDRSPLGRGRAQTWDWPKSALEVTPAELSGRPVDVVVVQRPVEEALAAGWLGGRVPGRDVPMVWLEHNTPPRGTGQDRHPAADRTDVALVHVTPTNQLLWDTGSTPSTVIEHGVIDPHLDMTGTDPSAAVVINEPGRRGRAVGFDLLGRFAEAGPLSLYGMGVDAVTQPGVTPVADLTQAQLHERMRHHRAYLHPFRWTSLGLSLVEAMFLGLPIVALATAGVPDAVPVDGGCVTNRVDDLTAALRRYLDDPALARAHGQVARRAAQSRFGLERFLDEWDLLLKEVAA